MAVTIDDLQVETQPAARPAGAGSAPGGSAPPPPKTDFQAEMERLREREMRLRAD